MATAGQRAPRRAIDGVLVLDKPVGLSSTAALQRARRLLGADKAGHTGTLDPLASGVLPLCFGAATKLAQAGLDADKRYLATFRLGVTTTTGDREGDIVAQVAAAVSRDELAAACAGFVGRIAQTPPMHSALKHDGRPLYAWARAGIEVERPAREIEVFSIDVVDGESDRWTIAIACSKGTYVRTLAESIGAALGCGAHLEALRRTGSGGFDVAGAVTLDALSVLTEEDRASLLHPVDSLIDGWPRVDLDVAEATRFVTGLPRRIGAADERHVRVYGPIGTPRGDDDGAAATGGDRARGPARSPAVFLGIAHIADGALVADRLLSADELSRSRAGFLTAHES